MPKSVKPKRKIKTTATTTPTAPSLSPSQRALIAEFTNVVQHMPTAKVRPLVELLTQVRGQNYVNVDLFEMIKRETGMDVPASFAKFAGFLELMGTLTTLNAKHIEKQIKQIGEHGEKSMYRMIAFEIESLKEGIRRGAASLA